MQRSQRSRASAAVLRQESAAYDLCEPGYGDEGGLGLVAAGPRAGRVIRALGFFTGVLDRHEEGLAVRGEGGAGQLGLDGPAGELEDVASGDPLVYTGRHHERTVVLEAGVDARV